MPISRSTSWLDWPKRPGRRAVLGGVQRGGTREGKWQVELAQLKYLLPRLAGSGTALSRLGGGIGTRGPGETKLETDRRRVRPRITRPRAPTGGTPPHRPLP